MPLQVYRADPGRGSSRSFIHRHGGRPCLSSTFPEGVSVHRPLRCLSYTHHFLCQCTFLTTGFTPQKYDNRWSVPYESGACYRAHPLLITGMRPRQAPCTAGWSVLTTDKPTQ